MPTSQPTNKLSDAKKPRSWVNHLAALKPMFKDIYTSYESSNSSEQLTVMITDLIQTTLQDFQKNKGSIRLDHDNLITPSLNAKQVSDEISNLIYKTQPEQEQKIAQYNQVIDQLVILTLP